jgi:hypothetical protein
VPTATYLVIDPADAHIHEPAYHVYDVPWLAAGFAVENLIFTGALTIAILIVPAWLMRGSRHQILFKALALVLTGWVPLFRVLLQGSVEEFISAVATQLLFCCLVPLPSASARDRRVVSTSTSPGA